MAATSVGEIGLDLVVNQNQFNRQMSGIKGIAQRAGADISSSLNKPLNGIASMAKKAGAALAGAFAVKKLVDFGKQCVELGSDLAEVQNVVDVTFPSMTAQVDTFAKNAAASFGLSETMAKRFTGTFGAMARAFGFSEQQAYDMSTTLTGLAGDVASFYNISQDEAYTKLKSVFTGETETLKDLGVVMTQNALDAYAMANGWGKTTQAMSEAEKVALRYQFVQDQLTAASGDFTRTSDSWANQVRVLKLQFDSLKATIGQGLINALSPALKALNGFIAKLQTAADAFKSFTEKIFGSAGGSNAVSDAANAASDLSGATDSAADGMAKTEKAAKKVKKALAGFDELNILGSGDTAVDTEKIGSSNINNNPTALETPKLNVPDLKPIQDFANKVKAFFAKIQKAVQPSIDAFQKLWKCLAPFREFTWQALKDFYNEFLKPIGKWVLGTGIPQLVEALNKGLSKIDWKNINQKLKDFWKVLEPFAQNIGEGLLWFLENVLVPLGTWVVNEAVPKFLDIFSGAIKILNGVIEALKPLWTWLWETFLKPIAEWTGGAIVSILSGIADALEKVSDWISKNQGVVQAMSITVAGFFAAWKATQLLAFISQSGGLVKAFGNIRDAIAGATLAKIKDKAETIALTALYAKDLVTSIAKATFEMGKQITQWALLTGAKILDAVKTGLLTAATRLQTAAQAALNFVLSLNPISLVIIAVAALVAGFIVLWNNCEGFRQFFIDLWDTCVSAVQNAWDWICGIFGNVANWFKDRFQEAWNNVSTIWGAATGFFKNIWDGICKIFGTIGNWFKETFQDAWNNITGIWDKVGGFFKGVWDDVATTTKKIWDGIWTNIKGFINLIIDGINMLWTGIYSAVRGIIDGIGGIAGAIGDIFGQDWHFSMPPEPPLIPKLARGGLVKSPTLAIVGDNPNAGRDPEVVAPLSKLQGLIGSTNDPNVLRDILRWLAKIYDALQNQEINLTNVTKIDSEELERKLTKVRIRKSRRYAGGNA